MKKMWIIFGVVALTLTVVAFAHTPVKPSNTTQSISNSVYKKAAVVIAGRSYVLDIADTDALRELGLSYRTALAPQTGMLFVFDTPGVYPFWMKDMNFPLDIIWLDQNKTVVYIERALSPQTYPQTFGPQTPTQYVIELTSGTVDTLKLSVGDNINF